MSDKISRRFTTVTAAGGTFSGGTVSGATTFQSTVTFKNGTFGSPAFVFADGATTGFYFDATATGPFYTRGSAVIWGYSALTDTFQTRAGTGIGFSSTSDGSGTVDAKLFRHATGVVRVGNATGLGYVLSGTVVTANTGTATPAVTASGTLYSNTGDTDGSIITLPNDPTIGTTLEAFADVSQGITINAAAGESIQDGAVNGTSTVCSTQGAWMRLVAITGGSGAIWGVCGKLGTWVTT